MKTSNLLVITRKGTAVSIPRELLDEITVERDTVMCVLTDGSQRRIGPYESSDAATEVFDNIIKALAGDQSLVDVSHIPLKEIDELPPQVE